MGFDWGLQLELEELDRLTPGVPPIAPRRPPQRVLLGSFIDGVYVAAVDRAVDMVTLSDGREVSAEWAEDNVTSWACV